MRARKRHPGIIYDFDLAVQDLSQVVKHTHKDTGSLIRGMCRKGYSVIEAIETLEQVSIDNGKVCIK